MSTVDPTAALARRFTINWLNLADASVPPTIMTDDYQVHIGTVNLTGLEPYTTGTMGQLNRFPGLTLTVHELVTNGSQLALVFSEHGASVKDDGRAATWRGVALFRCADGLLAENWTQEDYYARRRQLTTGRPDVVPSPAIAPWTVAPAPADLETEEVVRSWLGAPRPDEVQVDDGSALSVRVEQFTPSYLFSAGDAVAFAGSWTGRYLGGLAGATDASSRVVSLGVCGVVHVGDGKVTSGQIVTDRHGLRRSLLS